MTTATGSRSIATATTAVKGKRGRKKKTEGSVVNGKNPSRPPADGSSTKAGGEDLEEEEEEDDEEAGEGLVNEGDDVDDKTEKENLASVFPASEEYS